ncbi:MAG: 5'-nucleotidase C-terminal domain-containing protein, partial [Candidatus Kapabacteria bacterium]|nr:5'-nucleotidase C-terminal domain-containing protein [Candidatus Kapabacteria bacterium]
MGILPFENQLYLIKMRGKDIKTVITNSNPYVAGVDVKSDFKLDAGGMLDDTTYYQVLVNDFIYEGGDYFDLKDNSILLKETGINIRIPFEDYIRELRSSWNHPINQYLDKRARYR